MGDHKLCDSGSRADLYHSIHALFKEESRDPLEGPLDKPRYWTPASVACNNLCGLWQGFTRASVFSFVGWMGTPAIPWGEAIRQQLDGCPLLGACVRGGKAGRSHRTWPLHSSEPSTSFHAHIRPICPPGKEGEVE
jgi:hypothetical protein